jgi:hypothetical protein
MVKYTTITETSPVTVTTTTSLVRYVTSTVTIIKQAINENYALGALIIVIIIIAVVLVLIHR